MKVLAVDVGGTHIKIRVSGQDEARKISSGPQMNAERMIAEVKKAAADWEYEAVSIGYPGRVHKGRIVAEPFNLGPGWVDADYDAGFGKPVKLINDAAMQALGSYRDGMMLFLGFGTGLGSALVVDGVIVPMEVGHLAYRKATYEDYVGLRGLKKLGKKRWKHHVTYLVDLMVQALHPDDIVLGGGNVKKLKSLPPGCRAGDNANAFLGGFRLWDEPTARINPSSVEPS